MKYNGLCLSALSLLGAVPFAYAGAMGPASSAPINKTGFFIGVGESYNSVSNNTTTIGTLSAVSGLPPLDVFSGTTKSSSRTHSSFAPEAQVGYFQHFPDSSWLWGIEFLYQYSHIKTKTYGPANSLNLVAPNINTEDEINFGLVQTRVKNQFVLPAFIGRSFTNSFVYLGTGPAVLDTQRQVSSVSDNLSAFYLGTANGFSRKKWVWGGAVQAGLAYYLNPNWFLKLNYTYTVTGRYETNKTISFSPATNGGLNSGTASFSTSQRLTAQEAAISINRVFSL